MSVTMQIPNGIIRFKSWFMSGGIVLVVGIWLLSGQFGGADEQAIVGEQAQQSAPENAVRVRTQSAETVMRTIVVNGKTAPARIVHLAAETDGRVELIGAERGASLEKGNLIVRLDERDRSARLAQADAAKGFVLDGWTSNRYWRNWFQRTAAIRPPMNVIRAFRLELACLPSSQSVWSKPS